MRAIIDKPHGRKSFDEIAESLLDGIRCPPTALRDLFPRFNIKAAVESPLLSSAGKLTDVDGELLILYASNLTKMRVEFTIAHELAHAVFDQNSELPRLSGETLERACDRLAAALLMPKRPFLARVGPPTIASIGTAARDFNVSLHAAAVRCEELAECLMFRIVDGNLSWKTQLAPVNEPAVKRLVKDAFAGDTEEHPVLLGGNGLAGWWMLESEVQRGEGTFLLRRKEKKITR